jgi:Putative zinc-finger
MNCAEFEVLLADYVDGTLNASDRAALEGHAATCSSCRELLKDVTSAVSFLGRADEITPPPELITRIAYQAPLGRIRLPFERQGFLSRLATRWLQPVLQPRLAMGMAMTILSFAMLERCTGVRIQHIQAADLNPVRIWGGLEDKAFRLKDRAIKNYENLRWVYEFEVRLHALQQQEDNSTDGQKPPANGKK